MTWKKCRGARPEASCTLHPTYIRLTWSLDTSAHLPIPNVVPSISWDANSALGEAHAPLGYLRILGGIVDQFILSSVIDRNHSISLPTRSPMDSTPICKNYKTSETYKWECSSRCWKYRVMCIALCDSVSHIKISVRAQKICICIASAQKQENNTATKQQKKTHTHTHLLIRACQKCLPDLGNQGAFFTWTGYPEYPHPSPAAHYIWLRVFWSNIPPAWHHRVTVRPNQKPRFVKSLRCLVAKKRQWNPKWKPTKGHKGLEFWVEN